MPTTTKSTALTTVLSYSPTRVHRLWDHFPAPVREPLLCLLSQILARYLQTAVGAKEGDHDNTECK